MSLIDNTHYRYAWFIRPVLAWLNRRPGGVSEPLRLWARQPLACIGFLLMTVALDSNRPPLSRPLRTLVRLRVAQLNACPFCIDLNSRHALACGVEQSKLAALAAFSEAIQYGGGEKAALAYAEAVTLAQPVNPELSAELKRHFGDDGLVALTAVIAHQNLSAKFNAALGTLPQNHGLTEHGSSGAER